DAARAPARGRLVGQPGVGDARGRPGGRDVVRDRGPRRMQAGADGDVPEPRGRALSYPSVVPKIAYLCTDLLFVSKIRETATRLGFELVSARAPAGLAAAADGAVLAVVDLRRPDAMAALDALAGLALEKVGFIDHERTEIMDAARERGCQA